MTEYRHYIKKIICIFEANFYEKVFNITKKETNDEKIKDQNNHRKSKRGNEFVYQIQRTGQIRKA